MVDSSLPAVDTIPKPPTTDVQGSICLMRRSKEPAGYTMPLPRNCLFFRKLSCKSLGKRSPGGVAHLDRQHRSVLEYQLHADLVIDVRGHCTGRQEVQAGAAEPDGCSVLSSNAMATAGASSVAIATLVADLLAPFLASDFERTLLPVRDGFLVCFDGEGGTRAGVVMFRFLRCKAPW